MLESLGTLIENFQYWEKNEPDKIYLSQPVNGFCREYTFGQAANQARRMANVLKNMQLPLQSHIGIVSKNCAHWIITDLAIQFAGHISVPFFPTLTAKDFNHVLVHSDCKVLFVGKLDDWGSMESGVPNTIKCIAFPKFYAGCPSEGIDNWDDLIEHTPPLMLMSSIDYDHLASITYTSGTTGTPKGVMITHRMILNALSTSLEVLYFGEIQHRFFSYLPLCHIAERNIVESGSLLTGGTIYFVDNLNTFQQNLQNAQPTHFLGVPRIWTKFQSIILANISQSRLNILLSIPFVNTVVKKKIKLKLGLSEAKIIFTGAAPIPASVLAWYYKLGINIREGYGMTENLGSHTLMPANNIKLGTVGIPYKNVVTRIDPYTQEVQVKTPWMTAGYYKEPELTAKLFKDGWLCTGDMGSMDEDGYLSIIGRVKDLFKCSKGEYIAPAPIEAHLLLNPFIEQVCVLGGNLPNPIALVVLSDLGKQIARELLVENMEAMVEMTNRNFKTYEALKKIIIVKNTWTVVNNLLTPTLKIKRKHLEDHFAKHLNSWFELDGIVIFE